MLRVTDGVAARVMTAVLVATAVALVACGDAGETTPGVESATAVAEPPRGALDSAWRSAVVAYAANLAFDSAPPAGETAEYVVGSDTTRIAFAPLTAAGSIPDSALHRGWIIGRTIGYGERIPLGIPVGVGYVWIDSISGGWRATHVPVAASDTLRTRPLLFGTRAFLMTERARALYAPGDSLVNWRCGPRCCIEGGGERDNGERIALADSMHSAAYPR